MFGVLLSLLFSFLTYVPAGVVSFSVLFLFPFLFFSFQFDSIIWDGIT